MPQAVQKYFQSVQPDSAPVLEFLNFLKRLEPLLEPPTSRHSRPQVPVELVAGHVTLDRLQEYEHIVILLQMVEYGCHALSPRDRVTFRFTRADHLQEL